MNTDDSVPLAFEPVMGKKYLDKRSGDVVQVNRLNYGVDPQDNRKVILSYLIVNIIGIDSGHSLSGSVLAHRRIGLNQLISIDDFNSANFEERE